MIVVDPGTGALGSKHEWGIGRLAEPADLLAAVEAVVPAGGRPWDGLKVLVTAGGTREPIDSVRFVGNRSSGRMGFALAEEAAALGAEVTVIAANVALARSPRVRYVDVGTAAELQSACEAHFAQRRRAAHGRRGGRLPARGRGRRQAQEGRARGTRSSRSNVLRTSCPAWPPSAAPIRPLVGFAAEHGEGALAYGRDKLARKGLDAVVVNDIARADIGFEGSDNEVTIVTAAGERHVPRASKAEIARAILDAVGDLRGAAERDDWR